MKQFLRYLLLIACVMMIGVWGWSLRNAFMIVNISNEIWAFYIIDGQIELLHANYGNMKGGFTWGIINLKDSGFTNTSGEYYGFELPKIERVSDAKGSHTELRIDMPFWLLFTPLFLLTAGLWYRPIRDRLGGKTRKGFPVEVKSECRNQPDLNHEGESNPKSE